MGINSISPIVIPNVYSRFLGAHSANVLKEHIPGVHRVEFKLFFVWIASFNMQISDNIQAFTFNLIVVSDGDLIKCLREVDEHQLQIFLLID